MIYLYQKPGDHSNILFLTIHFESFCLENKIRFYNFITNSFGYLYGLKTKRFCKEKIFCLRVLKKIKILKEITYDDPSDNSKDPKRSCIVSGWYFRRNNLVQKYKKYLVQKYSLKPVYYENTGFYKDIIQLKNNKTYLVGVHLRKGDYKHWQNGKYYFGDEVYISVMEHIKNLLSANSITDVKFLIFSNEEISSLISERKDVIVSKNDWYIDQFVMSECDLLIGPPSTFSGWASFIGDVPLKYIEDKDMNFSLNDFNIIEG